MKIHTLRIPTPFYVGPVNVYLMTEEPITLVDTGPRTDDAFRSLRDQVEAVGVKLEQIRRIVISHTHIDHMGQAARLKKISDATIYVHPWEAARMISDNDYGVTRDLLGQLGVPAAYLDHFEAGWGHYQALFEPAPDVQVLDEGDEIRFGATSFRVLHTPGHSPGHICLWHEGTRSLIAADTILKRITPNPVLSLDPRDTSRRFPSLRMYMDSLLRLRDLAPATIYGGHGDNVGDVQAYYNRMWQHVRDRQARMLDLFPPNAATAWEMSLKMFPGASGEHFFLALSEASAHLDLATDEGKLTREEPDGVEYYRLA